MLSGKKPGKFTVVIFAAFLLAILLFSPLMHRWNLAGSSKVIPDEEGRDMVIPLEKALAPEVLNKALRMKVGLHLENVYHLSTPDESFNADGWYWMTWPKEVQALMDANDIKSDEIIDVVNNINGWDFLQKPDREKPEILPDGSYYQIYRFSGSFYSDGIDLRHYPFNTLSIPIILEANPGAFATNGPTPVIFDLDADQGGLTGGLINLASYRSVGYSKKQEIHHYSTRFGTKNDSDYTRVDFRIFYRTPIFSSFATWIVPLLVLMAIVFISPSLEASLGDLRFAIPSAVLLTLVVMQQAYQAEVRPLPYLPFLDRLYFCSYIITLSLFGLFVWGTNVMESVDENTDGGKVAALRRRVKQGDLVFQVGGIGFLLIGAFVAWFTI